MISLMNTMSLKKKRRRRNDKRDKYLEFIDERKLLNLVFVNLSRRGC